ncbi:MAG: hypothetical protein PHX53_00965 [Syntrophales bacterium]|nr:hypothetical protein [Syntrophales bacterium]
MKHSSKLILTKKYVRYAVEIFFFTIICWLLILKLPAQAGPFAQIKPQYVEELTKILSIQIPGWQRDGDPTGLTMKDEDKIQTLAKVKFHSGGQLIKYFEIKIEDNGEKGSEQMEQIAEAKCTKKYMTKTQFMGFPALQLAPPEDSQFSQYGVVSSLFINVADKYLVTVNGNEFVDLDTLKAVANHFDLKKLAALN